MGGDRNDLFKSSGASQGKPKSCPSGAGGIMALERIGAVAAVDHHIRDVVVRDLGQELVGPVRALASDASRRPCPGSGGLGGLIVNVQGDRSSRSAVERQIPLDIVKILGGRADVEDIVAAAEDF